MSVLHVRVFGVCADLRVYLLSVDGFAGNQAAAYHIYCGLTLFQDYIPNQRFVDAIGWFHIQKQHLTVDWSEAFDLDSDWSADLSLDCLLSGGFDRDLLCRFQLSEAIAPRARQ